MARDVTPENLAVYLLFTCLCTITRAVDVSLVTKPFYWDDNLFFELVQPEDISYTYKIRPAKDFGTAFNQSYSHIELVPTIPIHSCSDISNTLYVNDNIALIQRGGCSFLTKTLNAEKAGALGVIVTDHKADNDKMIDMIQDETGRTATIPSFFLQGKDGYMILNTLNRLGMNCAVINLPINMTGVPITQIRQPPWTLW